MDLDDSPPFPNETTIPSRLATLAQANPDKPAFVFIDTHWTRIVLTRKDVWDWSRRFASMLNRMGIGKGDVVCNSLVNSPERIITHFGTLTAGAISLHGQMLLADGKDFFDILAKSKCPTVIVDPSQEKGTSQFLETIKFVDEKTGKTQYKGLPHLLNVIPVNVCGSGYEAWLDSFSHQDFYVNDDIDADDTASLFLTSGSTGFSKIVANSHAWVLYFGFRLGIVGGVFDENAMYLSDRSLGWVAGQPAVVLSHGCTHVLTNDRGGHPQDYGPFITKVIVQEKVDCGFIVPFDLQMILKEQERNGGEPPFRFRHVATGGGPITEDTRKCIGFLTDKVENLYGSTEAGCIASLILKDRDEYRPMCVGKPCPRFEIKLVDRDLEEVPIGQTGEVTIRSARKTKGYIFDHEMNQALWLPGGWLRSGDVAYFDDKGFLYICSRTSDAIMRGAYIHYPGWLETRIRECPGVQEVAIVGVPDEAMYEEVCACILPTSPSAVSEDEVAKFCDGIFVSTNKKELVPVPKYVLFFDEFLRNPNGKLRRIILKEEAKKRLKL